jgi:hypothetical protein
MLAVPQNFPDYPLAAGLPLTAMERMKVQVAYKQLQASESGPVRQASRDSPNRKHTQEIVFERLDSF